MNKVITDEEFDIVDQKRILIKLKMDIFNLDTETDPRILNYILFGGIYVPIVHEINLEGRPIAISGHMLDYSIEPEELWSMGVDVGYEFVNFFHREPYLPDEELYTEAYIPGGKTDLHDNGGELRVVPGASSGSTGWPDDRIRYANWVIKKGDYGYDSGRITLISRTGALLQNKTRNTYTRMAAIRFNFTGGINEGELRYGYKLVTVTKTVNTSTKTGEETISYTIHSQFGGMAILNIPDYNRDYNLNLYLAEADAEEAHRKGTITGKVINGNANIDADSDIRRTFSLTLVPDKDSKTFVDEQGYVWIDKAVKVSLGIVNELTEETYWWKFGKFVFTNTNTTYDATTNQLTINCSDLMSILDGSKNGTLGQLSIVFPAYKEFTEGADDIFYGTEVTYDSIRNTYTLSLENYKDYGLSDYIVMSVPDANMPTNPDDPNTYFRINTLKPIPIVDKETREPIAPNTFEENKFYAFFIDTDKLVYCSDGSLDSQAASDFVGIDTAKYNCTTMESVPHYSFEGVDEPAVGDMFFMHSDQLSGFGANDYVLPRIPMVEFDSGERYPILFHDAYAGTPLSDYYFINIHTSCFPSTPYLPCVSNTTVECLFTGDGYSRGNKWSMYHYRDTNRDLCDPLLYVVTGEQVYHCLKDTYRWENEGEFTRDGEKINVTYLDDYTYQSVWTRKIGKGKKAKTITQTDYRSSELYSADADYLRQFSKVIVVNLPWLAVLSPSNDTTYEIYGSSIMKSELPHNAHYRTCTVTNTISSKNEYYVEVNSTRPMTSNDSITCVINKQFKEYDEWYKGGIPFKNNPIDSTYSGSDYWESGVGGIPQSFPYGEKELTETDFYVESTKKAPLKLTVKATNSTARSFLIVDESKNPISSSAIKEGANTYSFLIDRTGKYAMLVPEMPTRPVVPYGAPLNYYTIRKAVLTAVGQLAHIRRSTCQVDDIGEYKAMPQYNPDYEEYREANPLWDNIPYDLEFSHGDTVLAILQKLRDLYPNYEMYFNEDGNFCCGMIPSGNEDPIVIPEKFFYDTIISENTNMDLTTVRNVCHAWGGSLEPDFYCDNGIYTDGSETTKYVDVNDPDDNTEYTKVVVSCFDAGTNTYTCTTSDIKVYDFFETRSYDPDPYYCLYTTLPKVSDGTPKYVKYHFTYLSDGSVDQVTEEWYEPVPPSPLDPGTVYNTYPVFVIEYNHGEETTTYPECAVTTNPGTLTTNQYYELSMYKGNTMHPTTTETAGTSTSSSEEPIPVDVYPYSDYSVRKMEAIRFYEGSNCIIAEIPGYDEYMTGDIIAIKIADNYDESHSGVDLNINNLGAIHIYDENTYGLIGEGKLKPCETYCFKIKKKHADGADIVGAYLLGSWHIQGIAALVESEEGEDEIYHTTSGKEVRKYSKEYFQEIYACPSVRLVVIPTSPFTCQKIGEVMDVFIDETNLSSDALAVARANWEIYKKARLIESISVTTKLAPFADVNIKIAYRRQDNDVLAPYIVKSVSHDLSGGTTTWQLMSFYPLYIEDEPIPDVLSVTVNRDKENHIDNVTGGGVKDEGELVTLTATPKVGYHHDGWTVNSGGVTIEDNQFTMPDVSVEVTAKAAANIVNITYDANGGTPDPKSEVISYGVRTTLNDGSIIERENAEFMGWGEESTDTLPRWYINTSSTEAFGYADTNAVNFQTLYAVWKVTVPGLYDTATDELILGWDDLITYGWYDGELVEPGYYGPDETYVPLIITYENDMITESNFPQDLAGYLVVPSDFAGVGSQGLMDKTIGGSSDDPIGGRYLDHVVFPDSTIEVGYNAFVGCGFTTFDADVTECGEGSFQYCGNLETVTLRNIERTGSTSIGNLFGDPYDYSWCTSLTTLNLLTTVNDTSDDTLEGMLFYTPNIETINFLEGSTIVPDCILMETGGCDYSDIPHVDISLPTSLTTIGQGAFYNCKIHTINIPSGLTTIGIFAETGYGGGITYGSFHNVHFDSNFALNGLTLDVIGTDAFNNSNITGVNCTVEYIGARAFKECSDLASVTISGTIEIGEEAFRECTGITSITIPNTVTTIAESAFQQCTSLASVTLPSNLSFTTISNYTFDGCTSLRYIEIPNSVTTIYSYAFYDCNLQEITLPSTLNYIGENAFDDDNPDLVVWYGGDRADWLALPNRFTLFSVIHCADGDINYDPDE